MIDEILNHGFVMKELERIVEFLQGEPENSDADAALTALMAAAIRDTSTEPILDLEQGRRRASQAAPIGDRAFIARDPVISLLQSALEQYYNERAPDEVENVPPRDGVVRRGSATTPLAAGRRLGGSIVNSRRGRRIFDRFSQTDPRWVSSVLAQGLRLFRRKHAFKETPAVPVVLDDRARVILVGDWGSGIPRAQKVSAQMRRVLDDGLQGKRAQHVIHLGDVYYSGFGWEYEKRVLADGFWPVRTDEASQIGSWSLNGNHDMYSGGHGYFEVLLKDPRFVRQQQSSYFSLFNEHWKILGLDSAWKDQELHGDQPTWVTREVAPHKGKVMLLSHHQPFSAYETGADELAVALEGPLLDNRLNVWFWGHEHRCMTFRPYDHVARARCIGHGGVPVYMWHNVNDPYPVPGEYEYRAFVKKGLESWALFGFAVLDFDGPKLHVRYIDEDGTEHLSEDM